MKLIIAMAAGSVMFLVGCLITIVQMENKEVNIHMHYTTEVLSVDQKGR